MRPRNKRILLIDDDESIRQFIEMALSDDGYEVQTAADGQVALDLLPRWPPHLILLDMRMPLMDGWAFSSAYRLTAPPHVPIIVITAARDAAGYAAEIGANAYLSKPFDLGELVRLVGQFAHGA